MLLCLISHIFRLADQCHIRYLECVASTDKVQSIYNIEYNLYTVNCWFAFQFDSVPKSLTDWINMTVTVSVNVLLWH